MFPLPEYVDDRRLALLLGLTVQEVRSLEAEGLKSRKVGRFKAYLLPDAVQWYCQRLREAVK